MVRFQNVTKRYGTKTVLDDLSFKVSPGQFVVLIGPSGCGKTTTLKMINRLIEPDSGNIFVNGNDIEKVDRVALRRGIGYVIQQIGLFPNMTVSQNICVVPKLLKYDKEKRDKIVKEMLEMVGMPYEEYAHKFPSEMSGGQQQRVGVLRALAASPPIVLMDEPFGALDPMTRAVLQEEIKKLQKQLNKTVIFVTHDMDEALNLADVVIFMENGRITQMAPPEELLRNPANELVREFLGKHIRSNEEDTLTAADFMRKNVYTAQSSRGIFECTDFMARHGIDTLLVTDDQNRYLGVVEVEDIRRCGSEVRTIAPLLRDGPPAVKAEDKAKDCFDLLIETKSKYLVVLSDEGKISGIITRTSMAKALAERLWG